jgi:hypothetical protein
MSKKKLNISEGFDSLISNEQPKIEEKQEIKAATFNKEIKINEVRATFIVNEKLLEKLKAIAYWERVKIKDVINNALEAAVKEYEKNKKAEIEPIPEK